MLSQITRFHWLRRAASHYAFWFGLPILLYLPTVTGPFTFDDLLLVLRAERYARGESPRLDLFRFTATEHDWEKLRDRGTFPWWAPEGRISFFRPLAEWSFYLDVLLFGRNPIGHRIVSLTWFAMALLGVRRLYLAASGDVVQAGTAAFFFGISQTVTQPATFICNRADLMVAVGLSITAAAYLDAARRPRRPLVLIAATGFVFALLAKEIAIGLAVAVLLHEVLGRPRHQRFTALPGVIAVVLIVIAIGYMAHYVATRPWHLGFGVDQERGNISFLTKAPLSVCLYSAAWTLGFPIDALAMSGAWQTVVVGVAGFCGAVIVVWYLSKLVRGERTALFFVIWATVFLVIGLMTFPSSRVLCVGTIGWAYLLGRLLLSQTGERTAAPVWLRYGLLATSGAVGLSSAIGTVVTQNRLEQQLRNNLRKYVASQNRPLRDGDTLVIAEPHDSLEMIFTPDRLEFMTGLRDVSVLFLASPGAESRANRQDDRTLQLNTSKGDLLDRKLYESSLGLAGKRQAGAAFPTRDFTAEIGEIAADGRVTSLVFRFNEPLTSARLHFYPPELRMLAQGAR